MDKRVCRQCRRNRRMTTDFDYGWCNSCIIDLKLRNIQLKAEIKQYKRQIEQFKKDYPVFDDMEGK